MVQPKIVEILKANSIIERDGVRHLLESHGIPCMTEQRDMITVLGHEMTLSLGAYSSIFDGYRMFVKEEDKSKAELLIKENFGNVPASKEPIDHARKFLISCLFSMTVLPVIAHISAIYHLVRAIQHKQKISPTYFIAGLLFWSIIPVFAFFGYDGWLTNLKQLILGI